MVKWLGEVAPPPPVPIGSAGASWRCAFGGSFVPARRACRAWEALHLAASYLFVLVLVLSVCMLVLHNSWSFAL